MAQDLNSLLQRLQELNQLAEQPGELTREQLEGEIEQVTQALKESLVDLGGQLSSEGGASPEMLVDVFQTQLGAILQGDGLALEESEETKKLAEELELLKRGHISG